MMNKMTRRTALKGATVTAAALAMPGPANATPDLASLIARWRLLNADSEARGKALDANETELYATDIPAPACARTAITWPGGELECPSQGWTVQVLGRYLVSREQFMVRRTDGPDRSQTLEMWYEPLPPEALEQIAKTLAEIQAYATAKAAHWQSHHEALAAWEADETEVESAFYKVVNYAPRDLADLMAKVAFLKSCPLVERYQDPDALTHIASALMRDIAAIA